MEAAPGRLRLLCCSRGPSGFVKAVFLGFVGVVEVAAWDDVTNPWGIGALVLGALFGLASFALLRGGRAARVVLAVLRSWAASWRSPTSSSGDQRDTFCLAAALDAVVLWLLYGPRSARDYFAT